MMDATSALATLSASDDPAAQLAAARRFVGREGAAADGVAPLAGQDGYVHSRLRVGYLSSDLCSHAVVHPDGRAVRAARPRAGRGLRLQLEPRGRLAAARPRGRRDGPLHPHRQPERPAGRPAASAAHEIDILVDLHGLTLGARPEHPGLPPGAGADDLPRLPRHHRACPASTTCWPTNSCCRRNWRRTSPKQPLYLPNCFQINDRRRAIGARPTRAACGLPEDAFVFCSLQQQPQVHARGLRRLDAHPAPRARQRAVAAGRQRRGAAKTCWRRPRRTASRAARLVFAGRVMPADYLARFQAGRPVPRHAARSTPAPPPATRCGPACRC